MMSSVSTFDLQQRLIEYSISVIKLAEKLPRTLTGAHLAKQLIRSGTSPALNNGEAQGAESTKDFVHKLISLQELRETYIALKIVGGIYIDYHPELIQKITSETDELASILFQSIRTAKQNDTRGKSV